MTAQLLEGSDAVAHAMVAAGCRFFAGYPMTPFTEVLEHMAKLLPGVDGVCMNAESELEAVGMAWGALATGLFATVAINSAAANGLFYGNPKQVLIQLVAIGAAWGWSIAGTFVILKVVNLFVPLRVHEDEEIIGLDLSQHGEPAYASINAN